MLAVPFSSVAGGAFSVTQIVGVLLKALLLTLAIVGAVALAVVAWPVIQQALIALTLIALFGWVTCPRKKAARHG